MRQHHNRAFRSPPYLHDGIGLDFRFGASLNCYVKVPGGAITRGALTDLFTLTGEDKSYYMGPAGLLVQANASAPHIEYDANGNCLGLRNEYSRTNLCLHSNDGTNAAWTKSNCTPAKTATGPDGVANSATTLTATAGNATCLQSITSASATRAYSIWLKRRTGTGNIDMTVDGGTGWTTKTITSAWARYEINQTAVTNPNMGLRIVTSGDAVDFWCSQIESAAFASTSIPTTTASVTRNADVLQRTLGSEFSATQGTVVVRGRAGPGNEPNPQYLWSINDGTFNESLRVVRVANSTTLRFGLSDGGVAQAALDNTVTNSTEFRVAAAWAANDFAVSFNGGAVQTDTAGTLPTCTAMGIGCFAGGSESFNGHILTFDYWPVRQPNNFLVTV